MISIPNALSVVRLLLVPVLYLVAMHGMHAAFLGLLALSFLTDLVDGPIARRFNQMSAMGAQLDSWADFAVYLSLPVWGAWLWPEIMRELRPYVTVVLLAYIAPVIVGVVKYGRLPSLHSYGAKLSAVSVGVSVILMFGFRVYTPFRLCAPLAVLTAIDEIVIILALRRWRPNVRTAWHAIRLRRSGKDLDPIPGATDARDRPHAWGEAGR